MKRSELNCPSCGEINDPKASHCINCGREFSNEYRAGIRMIDQSTNPAKDSEVKKFYRRLPMRMITIVALLAVDYLDDQIMTWSYYPAAAIAIFAILIPIIRYRDYLTGNRSQND